MFGDCSGCTKDAATNRVTDDDSEPEAQAKDTKKTTVSFGLMR
jgi:hypothetical protein